MIDLEHEHLERDPAWRVVLETYQTLHAESAERPEGDGWIPRVSRVEGIAPERLPVLHGRLIALGLLKFELAGRTEGLHYQLSLAGKQFLNRQNQAPDASDGGNGNAPQPDDPQDGLAKFVSDGGMPASSAADAPYRGE